MRGERPDEAVVLQAVRLRSASPTLSDCVTRKFQVNGAHPSSARHRSAIATIFAFFRFFQSLEEFDICHVVTVPAHFDRFSLPGTRNSYSDGTRNCGRFRAYLRQLLNLACSPRSVKCWCGSTTSGHLKIQLSSCINSVAPTGFATDSDAPQHASE